MVSISVEVDSQGVKFGNTWFSHEKITGVSASFLNTSESPIYKGYREWVTDALKKEHTNGS
jgi:hypothetical protein